MISAETNKKIYIENENACSGGYYSLCLKTINSNFTPTICTIMVLTTQKTFLVPANAENS